MKNLAEDLLEMTTSIMDQIKISISSTDKKYSPKSQDPTLWSRITRGIHYWKVDILKKVVLCGLSNMISDH